MWLSFGVIAHIMHPNFKKALVVGLIAGLAAAVLVFALCVWASTWPAASEVSVTWAFRPWWLSSNWFAALVAFAFVGVVFGVLAAFRPAVRRKQ
jgi:hypothetical protein